MRSRMWLIAVCTVAAGVRPAAQNPTPPSAPSAGDDPVKVLVERLDLASYKATVKGLTQFGDRRRSRVDVGSGFVPGR